MKRANARTIERAIAELADPERARFSQRFFRTGKGEYGEGDKFLGLTVPQQRKIASVFADASLETLERLLQSPVHEHRLTSLLILVRKYRSAAEDKREGIVELYLRSRSRVNNWDLVDSSAPYILGEYLSSRNRKILVDLAGSEALWDRRIAMVSTLAFIRKGELEDTFRIAEILLGDRHDLIHKAVGWMLREAGKRDEPALLGFLRKHKDGMPRTALRYAIERLSNEEKSAMLARSILRVR